MLSLSDAINAFYIHLSITICIIAPFDPNPNDGGFGVGGSVEEEEGNVGAIVGIIIGVISWIGIVITFICNSCNICCEMYDDCNESDNCNTCNSCKMCNNKVAPL